MYGRPKINGLGIGKVASLAGVSLTTVRFYERANIVRPVGRSAANYRVYSPDAVARIRFTRRAQQLGFTLREVMELLALRSNGGSNCKSVRANARAKIDDIKARILSLKRIQAKTPLSETKAATLRDSIAGTLKERFTGSEERASRTQEQERDDFLEKAAGYLNETELRSLRDAMNSGLRPLPGES